MSDRTADPSIADPFNRKRPTVYRLGLWQRILLWPIAACLRLYFRSWRIQPADAASRAALATCPPRLIVVWHNRSLVMPEVFRRYFNPARIHCLISPSRAAAWQVAFFNQCQLRVIRGSSSRRGIQAMLEMLRRLRAGDDVGISPDGPAGPLYSFREGAVRLGRKSGKPIILCNANCRQALRLRSWDRHLIPLPFARIELQARIIPPDDPLWQHSDPADALKQRLAALTRD